MTKAGEYVRMCNYVQIHDMSWIANSCVWTLSTAGMEEIVGGGV